LQAFGLDNSSSSAATKGFKWNQPFPHNIQPFPMKRSLASSSSDSSSLLFGIQPQLQDDSFLPAYLPPFPPAFTYKRAKKKVNKASKNRSNNVNNSIVITNTNNNNNTDTSLSIQQSIALLEERASK
jgi:hypothetical protein